MTLCRYSDRCPLNFDIINKDMKLQSNIIRTIIIAISGVMLVWVNLNFITAGTYIGSAVFGTVIAASVFFEPLSVVVGKMWNTVFGKIALLILCGIILLLVGICLFFSARMIQRTEVRTEKTQAVVVLGCQVRGETPSVMLSRRLNAALEVLQDNPQAVCVVSGGQGNGENISEAEAMRRYLIGKGIAEERIIKEDKSVSTYENISFSAEILKELGINSNIVIVTNEFHQYRAYNFAKKMGLETGAHSAHTKFANLANYWVREWAALFHQIVFGT